MTLKEFPFCKYYKDGTIEIFGNKHGTPQVTAVCPAPDVNTTDGEERQRRHNEACNGITLQGYLIVSKRLIRNEAFDKGGQKTTLQIVYRPCKNNDEIQMVHLGITDILKLELKK